MAAIVFYEKPGCNGNARQKAALLRAGFEVEAKNLLTEAWSAEKLRSFFSALKLTDWFNPNSPRLKSGEIVPGMLKEHEALALMLQDPLLIRRPLIEWNGKKFAGFDETMWLGTASSGERLDQCNAPHPCKTPDDAPESSK